MAIEEKQSMAVFFIYMEIMPYKFTLLKVKLKSLVLVNLLNGKLLIQLTALNFLFMQVVLHNITGYKVMKIKPLLLKSLQLTGITKHI